MSTSQQIAYLMIKLLTIETHLIAQADNPVVEAEELRCTGEELFWTRNRRDAEYTDGVTPERPFQFMGLPQTAYWQIGIDDTYTAERDQRFPVGYDPAVDHRLDRVRHKPRLAMLPRARSPSVVRTQKLKKNGPRFLRGFSLSAMVRPCLSLDLHPCSLLSPMHNASDSWRTKSPS